MENILKAISNEVYQVVVVVVLGTMGLVGAALYWWKHRGPQG